MGEKAVLRERSVRHLSLGEDLESARNLSAGSFGLVKSCRLLDICLKALDMLHAELDLKSWMSVLAEM